MKKLALFLTLAMVFSLALVGCTTSSSQPSPAGDYDITVNVGSEPDIIDPALNSAVDGATLLIHGFEGLMTLDENGTPIEGQAKSYTMSDDGLTYTFTLRDDLKWSDGTALVASDFVYAWNRAIAPDTAADYEYMFESIAGYEDGTLEVSAPDDKTVVVTLNAATPYFLELCAFPTFFPVRQDIVEAGPDTWATEPETYIGNGPYKLTEWVHDSYMVYEKNDNYWNVAALGPKSIKFLLMDDDNAILAAFQNEEILFADSMPNDEIQAWQEKAEYNQVGQLGTYYVSYNCENEFLKDPLVRKALTLAIDRDFICVQIGQAGQQPAGAYVPTGLTDADPAQEFRVVGGDYYDPTKDANEANLATAKQCLIDAGYPDGEGLPTFEYLYNTSTGHQQIGEALQDMWKDIGVNVELVSQEWNTFLNTRKNGEYDIARNGWLGDYNDPISFLDMWITGGGNNDAQWTNATYDALISQVKASSDRAERIQAMHDAEDILFDEWVLCPIYYYVDIYLQSEKLEGFYSSPLGYKYFMYTTVAE